MKRVTLLEELEQYRPWNEQEARDRVELVRRLQSGEDLYTRDNGAGHLTASAWVVSPDRRRVLMAYHNIYDSWSWLGGHADGDRDLLAVAAREVREESGLTAVRPVSRSIYSVEILTVDGHRKPDENRAVGWFGLEEAVAASSEPWFRERIYRKLNAKLARFPAKKAP